MNLPTAFRTVNTIYKFPIYRFSTINPQPEHNQNILNNVAAQQAQNLIQNTTEAQQPQGSSDKKDRLSYYSLMRIYKNHKGGQLLNLLLCNHILRYEYLVKNAEKFYLKSHKWLGGALTNAVINSSVGQVYTGGNTLENIYKIKKDLENKNVNLIINYCDEAQHETPSEFHMDRTAKLFVKSIEKAQEVNSNIGVKYSGFCDPNLMKKINKVKIMQINMFKQLCSQNQLENAQVLNGKHLYDGMIASGLNITEYEFQDFLKEILSKKDVTDISQVTISRIQWDCLVHPLYKDAAKNTNSVIQKMTMLTEQEANLAKNIIMRLDMIYEAAAKKPSSRIYVDAEQSYLQYFIESISVQYQLQYNKEEPMIFSTIQCYLKDSDHKLEQELQKQQEFGLKIGVKLVKGAYLNEEIKLDAKDNINEGFQATSDCYDRVAKRAIATIGESNEVLIAVHNDENVQSIKQYMKINNVNRDRVQFAQLLGMADFLTYSLPNEGFKTSKYVPFGQTEIMIPYLCRRAYEGFKFLNNVTLQEVLIKEELKKRISK
uniref:Proline dehydrogenase n=1 Tax=Philasterides dicentrarchi TaxID=282688 RepID=A0A481XSR6_9CILI|nr:proline dehydrogenase [Philasterides dicentrarchi]